MTLLKNPHLERIRQEVYTHPEMVFDNMMEAMLVLGGDATIILANNAAERLLGYSIEELAERPFGEILVEDDMELFKIIKSLVSDGYVKNRAMTCISKAGERIQFELNASVMRDKAGKLVAILAIMRDMGNINKLLKDLEESKNSLEIKVRERTADLERAKNDIESAYSELKQAQSQLLQSEKMASVGQLAAGVAHEINNPIGFIYSNLGSLADYIEDIKGVAGRFNALLEKLDGRVDGDLALAVMEIEKFKDEIDLNFIIDDLSTIIEESRDGASRVKKIVADLKDFSHVDEAELKPADINRGIESTLNIVNNELRYVASVKKDFGNIPEVVCYPQQLNQVFMNLLINAAQAINGKGEIGIKTYREGENIFIEISDTGCGIPEDAKARIFEPFFTTKPIGVGTGLGLSMSYSIIKKHGGIMTVESEVGRGTTFSIVLPVGANAGS